MENDEQKKPDRFRPGRFEVEAHKRSDEHIKEDVCERLMDSHEIDATDFVVSVSEGFVTLAGLVNNRQEKRLAEDLIEDLPGVLDVHNHLTVKKTVDGWIPRSSGPGLIKGLY